VSHSFSGLDNSTLLILDLGRLENQILIFYNHKIQSRNQLLKQNPGEFQSDRFRTLYPRPRASFRVTSSGSPRNRAGRNRSSQTHGRSTSNGEVQITSSDLLPARLSLHLRLFSVIRRVLAFTRRWAQRDRGIVGHNSKWTVQPMQQNVGSGVRLYQGPNKIHRE
jgi:hypothetical protein